MGLCLSKPSEDVVEISQDSIRLNVINVEPSVHSYVHKSSRLLDVVTEKTLLEYRISMSPLRGNSSLDPSVRGRSPRSPLSAPQPRICTYQREVQGESNKLYPF